ncbi:hypothetical protein [Planococcus sp. YIM B11945]|uniref:hypothetical protein n=1 Tax=Planococcus sp. YIM B11945 TaxID=3435410 RepID=UPI003D7CBA39
MENYEYYKNKLEKQLNRDIKDIIKSFYIDNQQGPSVSAKELGIPRQAFMYFVQQFQLKDLRYGDSKKKILI